METITELIISKIKFLKNYYELCKQSGLQITTGVNMFERSESIIESMPIELSDLFEYIEYDDAFQPLFSNMQRVENEYGIFHYTHEQETAIVKQLFDLIID